MAHSDDLIAILKEALSEAERKRGKVNILIAGQAGVGKSTLVNAVFAKRIAETGQGRPVTRSTRQYTKKGVPVTIFDTQGLELAHFHEMATELEKFVAEKMAGEPSQHIHAAWLCICEDSRRVQDSETELAEMFARHHIPVVGVITKARADDGFRKEVQRLLPAAKNVVRVRALEERDDDGTERPTMGLAELVALTVELVPEDFQGAFAAAQIVDVAQKVSQARRAVISAAGLAAAVGLGNPIPISDCALLAPIQLGMLAAVSLAFGLDLNASAIFTLLSSAIGTALAGTGGRLLVASLLRLLPGAGTLVGAAISSSVAAALTTMLGEAYIAALSSLVEGDGANAPGVKEIVAAFRAELSRPKPSGEVPEGSPKKVTSWVQSWFQRPSGHQEPG
ncbi:MAG TPA: GTPase, partial [Oscillatoriaceae cyanobacterium]